MNGEFVRLEREGAVAVLTIDRPQALNALNRKVLEEILAGVKEFGDDPEARVLIITGGGEKAFVAGADIAGMKDFSVREGRDFSRFGQAVTAAIENLPKPVIAAINGYALGGGCELAMACDIRIASEKAKIGQPEVNLGILPGFGGTQRLARLVGRGKAKELIFSAVALDAAAAEKIGLVDAVVPPEKLMERANEVATLIASKAPVAIGLAKEAINRGLDLDLADGLAYEAELFAQCFATDDQREGMGAFLAKRKPEFKGR
ncbi:MAG TPA: enoyl-CoA hydratase-related protein [Bacillota bacterium]